MNDDSHGLLNLSESNDGDLRLKLFRRGGPQKYCKFLCFIIFSPQIVFFRWFEKFNFFSNCNEIPEKKMGSRSKVKKNKFCQMRTMANVMNSVRPGYRAIYKSVVKVEIRRREDVKIVVLRRNGCGSVYVSWTIESLERQRIGIIGG